MMESYTLILTAPKAEIPSNEIIEFVKDLINSNLTNIEYFGLELDNGIDFYDEDMQSKFESLTYVILHFASEEINYKNLNEDSIYSLIIKKINENQIGQITVDEKDVEIYINEGQ